MTTPTITSMAERVWETRRTRRATVEFILARCSRESLHLVSSPLIAAQSGNGAVISESDCETNSSSAIFTAYATGFANWVLGLKFPQSCSGPPLRLLSRGIGGMSGRQTISAEVFNLFTLDPIPHPGGNGVTSPTNPTCHLTIHQRPHQGSPLVTSAASGAASKVASNQWASHIGPDWLQAFEGLVAEILPTIPYHAKRLPHALTSPSAFCVNRSEERWLHFSNRLYP